MFADGFEVGHDLSVVSHCDAISAGNNQCQCEGIHKLGPVLCCEYAFPEAESVEKLELLAEE